MIHQAAGNKNLHRHHTLTALQFTDSDYHRHTLSVFYHIELRDRHTFLKENWDWTYHLEESDWDF